MKLYEIFLLWTLKWPVYMWYKKSNKFGDYNVMLPIKLNFIYIHRKCSTLRLFIITPLPSARAQTRSSKWSPEASVRRLLCLWHRSHASRQLNWINSSSHVRRDKTAASPSRVWGNEAVLLRLTSLQHNCAKLLKGTISAKIGQICDFFCRKGSLYVSCSCPKMLWG